MWVLWLFVALPIIEIALFIQVGKAIGVVATLAWVILAAVLGLAVMRAQGAHAWSEAQRSLADLRDPTRPLAHGMMLMVAGLLLIVPGFFTDAIGLLLLIPPVRSLLMAWATRRVRVTRAHMQRHETYRPPYADGVIDADYVIEDELAGHKRQTPPDLPEDLPEDRPTRRGGSGWTRH